jgi:hypothetical protein
MYVSEGGLEVTILIYPGLLYFNCILISFHYDLYSTETTTRFWTPDIDPTTVKAEPENSGW